MSHQWVHCHHYGAHAIHRYSLCCLGAANEAVRITYVLPIVQEPSAWRHPSHQTGFSVLGCNFVSWERLLLFTRWPAFNLFKLRKVSVQAYCLACNWSVLWGVILSSPVGFGYERLLCSRFSGMCILWWFCCGWANDYAGCGVHCAQTGCPQEPPLSQQHYVPPARPLSPATIHLPPGQMQ